MKVAVYTCITDGYDRLLPPASIDSRLDYLCFTDDPGSVVEPWKYREIHLPGLDAKEQNRFIKMHPQLVLPEYDVTLYLDGSIEIVGDVLEMIVNALKGRGDLLLYEHPLRACAYREAALCAHYAHDWIWTIARQMRRYRKEGYPENYGLFEANVILRRASKSSNQVLDSWWAEYTRGAKRDQLSLPFVCWKLGRPVTSLGNSDTRFAHQYFRLVHRSARRRPSVILRKYINRLIACLIPYRWLFSMTGGWK